MKKEKLKLTLVNSDKKDFLVGIPERFRENDLSPSTVRLEIHRGEYQYFSKKHTTFKKSRFTSEELRAIADKLDELNHNEG